MVLEFRKPSFLSDEYQNLVCWLIFIISTCYGQGSPLKLQYSLHITYSVGFHVVIGPSLKNIEGAQWLSGRVLVLRTRGLQCRVNICFNGNQMIYSYFMPVCSIVKTITPRCRGRPDALLHSAFGLVQ